MIHMNQIKVPLALLRQSVPKELLACGKIGAQERQLVLEKAAGQFHLTAGQLRDFCIEKKSIDARKKSEIHYVYQVSFSCTEEEKRLKRYGKKANARSVQTPPLSFDIAGSAGGMDAEKKERLPKQKKRPLVVGFGPAGMFAAYTLAKNGKEPIVIERGLPVEERLLAVQSFWEGKPLNTECNVQFGEGGAGTFSDGKLNTMTKDKEGRNRMVLRTFAELGAPSEILYLQKPHIGTDCLREVVRAMRQEILSLGGEIRFQTRMEQPVAENGRLVGVWLSKEGKRYYLDCDTMIVAVGHSARDTFSALFEAGLLMEPKAFAVGVRVEHPQEMIGKNQYGDAYSVLPAADYKLTWQTQEKRGVYSFCMCPGGYVVNASSEQGRLAVNGMSNYRRDSKNANSAIVVTVSPEDFGGSSVFAGVEFQRKLEQAAFEQAQGKIPVQLFGDFCQNKTSTSFGGYLPEIKGQYAFGNVRAIFPEFIGKSLAEGICAFDRYIAGFAREDAIVSGVESRTSSPVRMVRGKTLESNIAGIYPCGEGAGYAGGITSAAMDGIRVAQQILSGARV